VPLTLITLAVARIGDHRKNGARPDVEITTLKDALLDSNAELASRLVGQLGSRNGYAVHATFASYPHDSVREMRLGEAPSREVRLAAPLLDARLLWVPDEDLLTHPDRLNFEGKIRRGQHPKGSKDVPRRRPQGSSGTLAHPTGGSLPRWLERFPAREGWVFGCASCISPNLAVGQIKPIARHLLAL
jgi:hypothetical protein